MSELAVVVDGKNLTILDVVEVARESRSVVLSSDPVFLNKIREGREFYLKSGVYAYGDKMGVGANVGKIIPEEKRIKFQKRLIDSLSCGVGEELQEDIVRAAMLLRANSLVKEGCSAIGADKIERIIELLNSRITPVMYKHGSVGASGDLVPLSSIAAAIEGKGKVKYRGKTWLTERLYKKLSIKPLTLYEKEGLSLVNGTSAMTAMATLALYDAQYIVNTALMVVAMATEALGGMTDPFDEFVQKVKNHEGQIKAASTLRAILFDSRLTKNIESLRKQVRGEAEGAKNVVESSIELQDPYSIRCAPQLFGPVLEMIDFLAKKISDEMNSANDNPIVNLVKRKVHHTGNFSGFYISLSMDTLRLCMFNIANHLNALKERLINEKYNRGLGASLAGEEPGFNSGFKGVGICLSDIFGRVCFLASPYSVHCRTTESFNQDIVSFGFGAAEIALELNSIMREQLAGMLIMVAQALDIRSEGKKTMLAPVTRITYGKIRQAVEFMKKDRPMTDDIRKVLELLEKKAI